ncbi:MAG: mechanosensitive ion channel [Candidatus Dadabacteria bacterium]|nr:mechanosensitive ion channel [Candidatus Dadabacteria bacterium]NIQ13582.1 mechanosensitive ion channel [Candidatus Dadabacteria bacterium]
MEIHEILNKTYLDNTLQTWFLTFGIAIVVALVLNVVIKKLIKLFKELALKTHNDIDDLIAELLEKTSFVLLIVFSLIVSTLFLNVTDELAKIRLNIIIIALILQFGFWASGFVNYFVKRKISGLEFKAGATITQIKSVGFVIKVVLWIAVVLIIIDNFGFDITTLIAGLGIGGIAIALAVQNVLGDLIASLSIILDRPFEIGDFIIVDDLMGDVEDIGLKTTRVRSLSGEQLIFSNNDLLQSRIKNYKRMNERRVLFNIGLTYDTPVEKLKKVPEIIQDVIDNISKARFDRAFFKEYGDFSLNFEIVYYVSSSDYSEYAIVQQDINLGLLQRFIDEKIDFAYPTQTLFMNKLYEQNGKEGEKSE